MPPSDKPQGVVTADTSSPVKQRKRGSQASNPASPAKLKQGASRQIQAQPRLPSVALVVSVAIVLVMIALLAGKPWLAGTKATPRPQQEHPGLVCSSDERASYEQLVAQLGGSAMLHNVELETFSGVRGLKAARHIPRGSPVLAVPFASTLSIATSSAREAASKATRRWGRVEDGDIQLDTLALLYEVYVKGPASQWAAYLCTIPTWFDLPLQYNDSWSMHAAAALPDLKRLVDKRKAQVAQYEVMTRKAIAAMPGGAARLKQDKGLRDFSHLFKWAYMATKTRTVTLDLDQPLGQVKLPHHFKWLTEIGVLVPVLDLANHQGSSQATATFAVDMTASSLTQGQTPVMTLVAARDIQPGEQITFSYLPDDDDTPFCDTRWLLEYGFIIQDGKPQRDCYVFNASLSDLAQLFGDKHASLPAALQSRAKTPKEWARLLKDVERDQGVAPTRTIGLMRGVASDQGHMLVSWVHEALGGTVGEADTMRVVCMVLNAHRTRVSDRIAISKRVGVMGSRADPGYTYRQTALMELLVGAGRALSDEMQHLGCVV